MSVVATISIEWPDSITREDVDEAVETIFCGCIPMMPAPICVTLDEFDVERDVDGLRAALKEVSDD